MTTFFWAASLQKMGSLALMVNASRVPHVPLDHNSLTVRASGRDLYRHTPDVPLWKSSEYPRMHTIVYTQ